MANVDELSNLILKELEDYNAEVDEIMQNEVDKIAAEITTDLKNDATIPKRTGKYKKGFYLKKVAQGKGYNRVVVANRKYQLTHLLEYGHVTKTGSRTKAFPHWKKAQEKANTLPERIRKAVEK